MSSPDRPTLSKTPAPVVPSTIPTALRRDGTAPRTRAERLLMLLTLAAIALAVMIPTLVVTGLFGQHPKPKTLPALQPTPLPDNSGLRQSLERSANNLLPIPTSLAPDPIPVSVRPEHLAARAAKIVRQAAQFGGTAAEGVASGQERHLFVVLPAAACTAFRLAVMSNAPVVDASPAPSPSAVATVEQEHVEVIIRPAGDDE